ncbi:hypothetical protein ACOBQX_09565 [Actinokineospora sp. G85]|uniref:hypothetical protein n=1 Tax=Actinokineospora sp. G85 TaxID=3406626 RepID=UPI003C715D8E
MVTGAFGASATERSDDWVWVRYLASAHPYSTVRTAAWSALVSGDPDAAIEAFVESGYDYAVSRAQERGQRNLDFIRRVHQTTTSEYSPELHAEATRLLGAGITGAERELFVRSGYEAAKTRDRAHRQAVGEQENALLRRDWDFVRELVVADPGEQVRLSASLAVGDGATADDLVEFFAHGWATGARLDLEAFRLGHAHDTMRWRAAVVDLIANAEAAEQAALAAAGAAREQAKAAAAQAWRHLGDHTAPARSSWADAGEFALLQAGNWRSVLAAAQAAAGPNWTSVIAPAQESEVAWLAEREAAARQSAYWAALFQQAQAGEQRVIAIS